MSSFGLRGDDGKHDVAVAGESHIFVIFKQHIFQSPVIMIQISRSLECFLKAAAAFPLFASESKLGKAKFALILVE